LLFEYTVDARPDRYAKFVIRNIRLLKIRVIQQGSIGAVTVLLNHISDIQKAIEKNKRQIVPTYCLFKEF
jgi:hypothetical protein